MFEDVRQRRAARRVKPGDGRPLQRFRWWQLLNRSLFYLTLDRADGRRTVYAVDVRAAGVGRSHRRERVVGDDRARQVWVCSSSCDGVVPPGV